DDRDRSLLGQQNLGLVLELGPEGNLGSDHLAGVRRLSAHAGDARMARTPRGLLCNSRIWCRDLHLPRRNVSASRLTRVRMRTLRAGGAGLEYGLGPKIQRRSPSPDVLDVQ